MKKILALVVMVMSTVTVSGCYDSAGETRREQLKNELREINSLTVWAFQTEYGYGECVFATPAGCLDSSKLRSRLEAGIKAKMKDLAKTAGEEFKSPAPGDTLVQSVTDGAVEEFINQTATVAARTISAEQRKNIALGEWPKATDEGVQRLFGTTGEIRTLEEKVVKTSADMIRAAQQGRVKMVVK